MKEAKGAAVFLELRQRYEGQGQCESSLLLRKLTLTTELFLLTVKSLSLLLLTVEPLLLLLLRHPMCWWTSLLRSLLASIDSLGRGPSTLEFCPHPYFVLLMIDEELYHFLIHIQTFLFIESLLSPRFILRSFLPWYF